MLEKIEKKKENDFSFLLEELVMKFISLEKLLEDIQTKIGINNQKIKVEFINDSLQNIQKMIVEQVAIQLEKHTLKNFELLKSFHVLIEKDVNLVTENANSLISKLNKVTFHKYFIFPATLILIILSLIFFNYYKSTNDVEVKKNDIKYKYIKKVFLGDSKRWIIKLDSTTEKLSVQEIEIRLK